MTAATQALPDGFHLSFSISQSLWADLLGEALPIQVGSGAFDAVQQVRGLLTTVQNQVSSMKLLESPKVPAVAAAAGVRALHVARRARDAVARRVDDWVRINGTWKVTITREGSSFLYTNDGVTLNARVLASLDGKAVLMNEQVELPFAVEKTVDGTITLGEVQFDRNSRSLQGRIKNLGVDLGEHFVFQALKPWIDQLLEQKVASKVNPLTMLKGEQLENLITPGQGPLKLNAGISDLLVLVDHDRLTLSVKFAFRGVH